MASVMLGSPMVTPDAEVSRSWLLVSAERVEAIDDAVLSSSDQVIIDLEDAIDPSRKDVCRSAAARWLTQGGSAWVRVNDRTSRFWAQDVAELSGLPGLRGVMLAKTDEADHVVDTWQGLGSTTPVIALIESALGIENAVEISRAQGAFRLAFGSGDYRRDTGTASDDMAMVYPRSRLVVASRVGHLPGPIDGPSIGARDDALRARCRTSMTLGLTGKLCLEPEQLSVINAEISPSAEDVSWAVEILADFEARGRIVRDGSDLPRVVRAERISELARAFGLHPHPARRHP